MPHQHRIAPQPPQPFYHLIRIGHTAAQEQQLSARRRHGQSEFIVQTAVEIADHLVFIDHQQVRPIAMHETALLGFQSCGENRGIQILCQISRGNPHRPIRARHSASLSLASARVGTVYTALPLGLPMLAQSSKINVLPAPVGACTTTSFPACKALTASCCQRSGTVTESSTVKASAEVRHARKVDHRVAREKDHLLNQFHAI